VLVTGAAGGVGRTVCRVLLGNGLRVRGLIRPEDDARTVPDGCRHSLIRGYVQDPTTVARALEGADGVVHCAALLPGAVGHMPPTAFAEVNVGGSVNVLRQASRLGVAQAVFFSTISVVDHVTREVTPQALFDYVAHTRDPYLQSKITAERELLRLQPSFPGRLSILRPGFIYGPGNYAVWAEALRLTRLGKMRLIGDGSARLPLIYAEDIGRFLVALLDQPAARPCWDIHVLANPETTTMEDVFNFLADRLGAARPRRVPLWGIHVAACAAALLPEPLRLGRLKLLTRAKVRYYSSGYRFSAAVLDPLLLRLPLTGYREGFARMLEDYLGESPLRSAA
jgi:nucleoside-diphosphate-sugar epimerase